MLDFFSFLLEYDAIFKYIYINIYVYRFLKNKKQIFMFIHALKSS